MSFSLSLTLRATPDFFPFVVGVLQPTPNGLILKLLSCSASDDCAVVIGKGITGDAADVAVVFFAGKYKCDEEGIQKNSFSNEHRRLNHNVR